MSDDSFNDRMEYGKEAVDKTIKCFIERGILFKTSKGKCGKEWSIELDKEFGDVFIYKLLKDYRSLDVKRNSFSINSLNGFKGYGFIIWNHELTEAYIYKLDTLMEIFYNKEIPKVELRSKDLGIKYVDFCNKDYKRIKFF